MHQRCFESGPVAPAVAQPGRASDPPLGGGDAVEVGLGLILPAYRAHTGTGVSQVQLGLSDPEYPARGTNFSTAFR